MFTNSSMLICTGEATATQARVKKKTLKATQPAEEDVAKGYFLNICGDFIKCSDLSLGQAVTVRLAAHRDARLEIKTCPEKWLDMFYI